MKIYPRYKREDSLRCKLSDCDIKKIQLLKETGYSNKHISELFDINPWTVWYWTTTKENRKEWQKKSYLRKKNKPSSKDYKKFRERKKIIQPEITKWHS